MIRDYSEMVPLGKAVQMTFSGQYPCALCRVIAGKKPSEDAKTAALFQHEKKLVAPAVVTERPETSGSPQSFEIAEPFFRTWTVPPPTPPPRFA